MRLRLAFALLLVLLTAALLITGCGIGGTSEPALNLYGIDPITLDPAVAGEGTSHQYIEQIFEGLVGLDDVLNIVPAIARTWEISNGGRTYTFHLRPDAKFQDGRQIKAADFKYSWERAATPATTSQTAAAYLGDIVGVNDMLAGKATALTGVKVIDDTTLEVTIDAPKAYFLYKLSYPTSFVVDQNNVKSGRDWWRRPNGSGAFKLKTWDQNSLLVLESSDRYYDKSPRVKTVNFKLYAGVPMNLYELGQIDVTSAPSDYVDKVTDQAGPFYKELRILPELSFSYIGFNVTRPPFDDPNIRRAFSMAIDKDKLDSLVFESTVLPATGIMPPGLPGYNPGLSFIPYDVAKAKQLIAASKYGSADKLPPITLTTTGYGLVGKDTESIIQEWRQNLGVEVKVRQLEPERFLYYLKQETDEMYSIGWIADYPHPQDFLDILFRTGVDNNYGGYSSPEVDALLQRAALEPDVNQSFKLYQQAEQKIVDDAAVMPLWFGKNYVLTKPYVQGYRVNPMGLTMLKTVTVDAR